MLRLSGEVAIVTGSSGGIGSATALELAEEGADVMLQYRSKENEVEVLAGRIRSLGRRVMISKIDFMDVKETPRDVQRMVSETINQFGKIDILVNLAGYPARGEWKKRFLELTPEDLFKPINVDLFGSFLSAHAVAPYMLEQKKGVIVNVSSTPAFAGHDKGFAFTVAKAAVIGLTKALAHELAPHVRVNTIALGNVETEWVDELSEFELCAAKSENLVARLGTPQEIARCIAFLCSDDSSFVNGQTLVIDGGAVLH
jgi:3-oxoacyl-[acyl-carrier protein] reductase